jgi:hopanoid biosynthesis associated protein HpnK
LPRCDRTIKLVIVRFRLAFSIVCIITSTDRAISMTSNSSIATRAVIVTADDFGFSREVNAGIIRAHREGILTATSLMVAAAARDEAAALARENPKLAVGLHLVVCRGQSALSPNRLAGIVDASGNFLESPVRAGMRYYFNRDLRTGLRDEIRAQIELHLKLIGRLDHIDGHLNFHVHPVIADILIDLCTEYRVRCMRLPREPVFTTLALARDHAARKIVEAGIFRALSRRARRLLDAYGMRSTDWLFGLHQSGHLTEAYVLGVIGRLPPGITELYFHPAANLGGEAPAIEAQREVSILTGAPVRAALEEQGIRLTNFAEIASSENSAPATTAST